MTQFLTLLLGWVFGILSKVFGDYFSRKMLGPKLHVEFEPKGNFILPTEATVEGTAVQCQFVRVKVTNTGKTSARNCRGFLVVFERKRSPDTFELVEGGDDAIPLKWSLTGEPTFDLSPGVGAYLDVLSTWEGSVGFHVESNSFPNKLRAYLTQYDTYRLTIQVSAEEAEPQKLKLVFEWEGNWQDPKVDRHVETDRVVCLPSRPACGAACYKPSTPGTRNPG